VIEGTQAKSFEEKPQAEGGLINGGFFVLEPSVLELIDGEQTVWEKDPWSHWPQKASSPLGCIEDSGSRWTPCATNSTSTLCGTQATHHGSCEGLAR